MQVFPQSREWRSGNRDLPVCKTIRPAVSFWATRRALENVPNQSGAPSALLVNERTQERSQQWRLTDLFPPGPCPPIAERTKRKLGVRLS